MIDKPYVNTLKVPAFAGLYHSPETLGIVEEITVGESKGAEERYRNKEKPKVKTGVRKLAILQPPLEYNRINIQCRQKQYDKKIKNRIRMGNHR
jgi:hypothetical protein